MLFSIASFSYISSLLSTSVELFSILIEQFLGRKWLVDSVQGSLTTRFFFTGNITQEEGGFIDKVLLH